MPLTGSLGTIEQQFELIRHSHDAIMVSDPDRYIRAWNQGACEIYGFTEEEAVGRRMHELLGTVAPVPISEIDVILERTGRWDGELTHTRKDGRRIIVDSRQVLLRGTNAAPLGILEINRDISERKRSEAALLEAQKLESLGVLAGGVAHQFNNLLTGVLGNVTLALELNPGHPSRDLLQEAAAATETAADLTRQILAYSGKGRFFVELVNPREVIPESVALAKSSIPKHVKVEMQLAGNTPTIMADRSQVKQLLVNLLLNAAEAIEHGDGLIVISSERTEISPGNLPPATRGAPAPGVYCHMRVSDNGTGIDEAIQSQIFDPFFTTRFIGRGLGLSAVMGIVLGHHGFLRVQSRPGQGTDFDVFLPAA